MGQRQNLHVKHFDVYSQIAATDILVAELRIRDIIVFFYFLLISTGSAQRDV